MAKARRGDTSTARQRTRKGEGYMESTGLYYTHYYDENGKNYRGVTIGCAWLIVVFLSRNGAKNSRSFSGLFIDCACYIRFSS